MNIENVFEIKHIFMGNIPWQSTILYLLLLSMSVNVKSSCDHREFDKGGSVCVCNSTQCDFIGPLEKPQADEFLTYTSNLDGLRFDKKIEKFEQNTSEVVGLIIDRSKRFQSIYGFGGAFTDSSGINIKSLDIQTREILMRSYFSEDGLEYNLCRVPIGGTDFSTHSYSYDDGDEDVDLKQFKLASEDYDFKMPLIKIAKSMTNNKLRLFASAWTAPKWMKTNGKQTGGSLKTSMYQSWANYFVKFLDEYEKEGIHFWGITTGNEPSISFLPFNKINSVGWNAKEMSNWISENLGPTLRNSSHASIKLIALDDQRFYLPWFISKIFENNATQHFVNGIGVHWYWDFVVPSHQLTATHNAFPDKFLLGTEASVGDKPWDRGVKLGSWKRAESYAHDIIQDLQNWVTGWVDWNIALDTSGGPSYINNNVDSPIIVNASSGEFYKQPMFYAIGHFSKFISRKSVRIYIPNAPKMEIVAFERNDNSTVIVILNEKKKGYPVSIYDKLRGKIDLKISARSITTVIYW